MKAQKTPDSQNNPEEKYKARGIILFDFRLYYKARVIKTVRYWHINRHIPMEQNRPELNLQMYGQLIFNKGVKNTNGERIVSSTNGVG